MAQKPLLNIRRVNRAINKRVNDPATYDGCDGISVCVVARGFGVAIDEITKEVARAIAKEAVKQVAKKKVKKPQKSP